MSSSQNHRINPVVQAVSDIAYGRSIFFRHYHTNEQVNAAIRNESRMLGLLERTTESSNFLSAAAVLLSATQPVGNVIPATFWDNVPVSLTPEQLNAALQPFTPAADNTDLCCICQEQLNVRTACELSGCRHRLHRSCATQWFSISTRCPVCRASPSAAPISGPAPTPPAAAAT
jgi:hypothetical protein